MSTIADIQDKFTFVISRYWNIVPLFYKCIYFNVFGKDTKKNLKRTPLQIIAHKTDTKLFLEEWKETLYLWISVPIIPKFVTPDAPLPFSPNLPLYLARSSQVIPVSTSGTKVLTVRNRDCSMYLSAYYWYHFGIIWNWDSPNVLPHQSSIRRV